MIELYIIKIESLAWKGKREEAEYTLNFDCVSYIIFNANASGKIRIYTIFLLQVKHIISSNLQLLKL